MRVKDLDFDIPLPGKLGNTTIHQLFEAQVQKTPHKTAAVNGKEISYQALNEKANRLAWLLKNRGVGSGTVVGVLLERSPDMLAALLGIWKAGGACLPLQPEIEKQRLGALLEEAQAALLVADSGLLGKKSFTDVQRLQMVQGADIYITEPRPIINDLDALPIPDRSLVDYETYTREMGLGVVTNSITLQATRGCPYKCAYCHKIWPKTHVARSAEHIFSEVRHYYHMGFRRFAFIDDIFNLNTQNSRRFFEQVIKNKLDIHILFPSGLRADILTKDYVDLMVEAGTIHIALALETASPRLQKMIKKNMNIDKLWEIANYICTQYPQVVLNIFSMLGFPSETEEEAFMTLDFIKQLKWAHFVFISILKVYPNTDMEKLALAHGFSREEILGSEGLLFHQLTDSGQFDKTFVHKYQADFLNNYFLNKERLLHVLPHQMKIFTENEMVKKYNSFLPAHVQSFPEFLQMAGITPQELGSREFLSEEKVKVTDLNRKLKEAFPLHQPAEDALRLLLLDTTLNFSDKEHRFYDLMEVPLGLMSLLTYLNKTYGSRVQGKIAKSKVDFDNYQELKRLLDDFKPEVIGIRCMSNYRDLFHQTVSAIRQFGIDAPIIAGGPYASSTYKLLLQDPHIDLVVLGEGEITFSQLIGKILENRHCLPGPDVLKKIKGIVFRTNPEFGGIRYHSPAREVLLWDLYHHQLFLQPTDNPQTAADASDPACVTFTRPTADSPLTGVVVEHHTLLDYMTRDYPWTDSKALAEIAGAYYRETRLGNREAQEAFWKNQLSGEIPVLNLIPDFDPPARQNRDGQKMNVEISREETGELKQLALRQGTRLDNLLLALYNVLLFKLTRREDIIVGWPAAGEKHTVLQQVLSAFVPILPLRNYPSGEKTFDRFLEEVRQRTAAAYEYRYFPIETSYDTMLAIQRIKTDRLSDRQRAELKALPYGYEPWHSPVKLVFTAVEAADELFFSVLYRTRLFKEETIRQYFNHFKEIIAAVLENKHIKLGDINISYDFLEPETTLLQEAEGDFGF